MILRVKCSYFEVVITVNRPYFVPHTIPHKVFKFSTVPLVAGLRVTQRVTLSWINRLLFPETWTWDEPVLILVRVLIALRSSSVPHRLCRWPLVLAVTEIIGNLSNGRFRGDGDLDRKLSHDPCITAHDLANFPAVAGTSTTWRAGVCRCGKQKFFLGSLSKGA